MKVGKISTRQWTKWVKKGLSTFGKQSTLLPPTTCFSRTVSVFEGRGRWSTEIKLVGGDLDDPEFGIVETVSDDSNFVGINVTGPTVGGKRENIIGGAANTEGIDLDR